jgi:hypothetical protein
MNDLEFATEISGMLLSELDIPLESRISFFDDSGKLIASSGEDTLLNQRINVNCLGLYKPATSTLYVKQGKIPDMISTITHEAAHHFLLSTTLLGKVIKEMDLIYEVYKKGESQEVKAVIGDVMEDHSRIFRLGQKANEGFSTWVGHYALARFVEHVKNGVLESEQIDMVKLAGMIEAYESLAKDLDFRPDRYYYGRLAFKEIESFFGPKSVPLAAQITMNILYKDTDLNNMLQLTGSIIDSDVEQLAQYRDAVRASPDLRLIALSRLLPAMARRDDISYTDDPQYLLSAVKRYLGEKFLEPEIVESELEIPRQEPEQSRPDMANILVGELLCEIVYSDPHEGEQLLHELKSIAGDRIMDEMLVIHSNFSFDHVKKKALEILRETRDPLIRAGEAVAKLGYYKNTKELLDVLTSLKDLDDDTSELYQMVAGNEFKSVWDGRARDIKNRMSMRGKPLSALQISRKEKVQEPVEVSNNISNRNPIDKMPHDSIDISGDIREIIKGTDVEENVLASVFALSVEISGEGREGKAIGTGFVLGDSESVLSKSRQLILNPFEGHKPEERIITNSELKENIKELAQLDGFFVINGKGVVEASGRYITVDSSFVDVPKGLGTRHSSMAGITQMTDALGIVVSQSGGKIRIFKKGKIIKSFF